jgi:hypothetical protein
MHDAHFDALIRSFAVSSQRRQLLRRVAAALGVATAANLSARAPALAKKKKKKTCKKGRKRCGRKCVDIKNDAKNCGGCGNTCLGTGTICSRGKCLVATCPAGASTCRPPLHVCGTDVDFDTVCHCATRFDGTTVCTRGSVGCPVEDCNSDEDCSIGEACVDATGKFCSGCARGCAPVCNFMP